MNVYLPREFHRALKACAKRNGLGLNDYVLRTLRAAVESDTMAHASPSFLERWEKFLAQQLKKQ